MTRLPEHAPEFLIDLLYDTILYGGAWEEWLAKVVEGAGARSGLLVLQNTRTLDIAHTIQAGFDRGQRDRYDRDFRLHDVWVREMSRLPGETFHPSERVVSSKDFRRSLIYNEFCRGLDIAHAAGAFLSTEGHWSIRFALQRTRSQGAFLKNDLLRLQALVPHLRRCVTLADSMGLLRAGLDALLDYHAAPCMLVTPTQRVIALNQAARDLVAELPYLSLHRGQFVVKHQELAQRLDALIGGCRIPLSDGLAAEPALLKLPRKERPPLVVSAVPVPNGSAFLSCGQPVLLLFRDSERKVPASVRALAEIYGLTRAETRVAELIGAGHPVKRIATQLAVSVNAVKFHLKSIFAKTGTHRQSDLVSLILSVSDHRPGAGSSATGRAPGEGNGRPPAG